MGIFRTRILHRQIPHGPEYNYRWIENPVFAALSEKATGHREPLPLNKKRPRNQTCRQTLTALGNAGIS